MWYLCMWPIQKNNQLTQNFCGQNSLRKPRRREIILTLKHLAMILYQKNNSYIKLRSSSNIFCGSPNDVSLSVFNIVLSSFPLPAKCCLKSCTVEKGKFQLSVINHMSVPEDDRKQLLTKEIRDCYRSYGTVRSTKFRQLQQLYVWPGYENMGFAQNFGVKTSRKMTTWKTIDEIGW